MSKALGNIFTLISSSAEVYLFAELIDYFAFADAIDPREWNDWRCEVSVATLQSKDEGLSRLNWK